MKSEYSLPCANCQFQITKNAIHFLEGMFGFSNSDQYFSLAPSIVSYG